MARKRIIDPEFWIDETMANLDFEYRLFYIGTWNFSDDYGVLENSIKKLKAQIFPYDDIDIQPIVDKLISQNKLIPFEANGKEWLYIKNFFKYQRVDKPSKNRNPEAPKHILDEESPRSSRVLIDEVKLSEVKLSEMKEDSTLSYLKNISQEDIISFSKKYNTNQQKVKEYAEKIIRYCESKGRRYKNYKSALQSWLLKDFGLREELKPYIPVQQVETTDDIEARKKSIENLRNKSKFLSNKYKTQHGSIS